ncbi:hypothetical protein BKA70DRAFT_1237089 [Coprinopsis sp. MPI-PUGE-AT-0042]|nr:hypothetical protein BKA70DRAFT_1237089 [Coprinopsis sp. MPI-PUGE-AT-0042]
MDTSGSSGSSGPVTVWHEAEETAHNEGLMFPTDEEQMAEFLLHCTSLLATAVDIEIHSWQSEHQGITPHEGSALELPQPNAGTSTANTSTPVPPSHVPLHLVTADVGSFTQANTSMLDPTPSAHYHLSPHTTAVISYPAQPLDLTMEDLATSRFTNLPFDVLELIAEASDPVSLGHLLSTTLGLRRSLTKNWFKIMNLLKLNSDNVYQLELRNVPHQGWSLLPFIDNLTPGQNQYWELTVDTYYLIKKPFTIWNFIQKQPGLRVLHIQYAPSQIWTSQDARFPYIVQLLHDHLSAQSPEFHLGFRTALPLWHSYEQSLPPPSVLASLNEAFNQPRARLSNSRCGAFRTTPDLLRSTGLTQLWSRVIQSPVLAYLGVDGIRSQEELDFLGHLLRSSPAGTSVATLDLSLEAPVAFSPSFFSLTPALQSLVITNHSPDALQGPHHDVQLPCLAALTLSPIFHSITIMDTSRLAYLHVLFSYSDETENNFCAILRGNHVFLAGLSRLGLRNVALRVSLPPDLWRHLEHGHDTSDWVCSCASDIDLHIPARFCALQALHIDSTHIDATNSTPFAASLQSHIASICSRIPPSVTSLSYRGSKYQRHESGPWTHLINSKLDSWPALVSINLSSPPPGRKTMSPKWQVDPNRLFASLLSMDNPLVKALLDEVTAGNYLNAARKAADVELQQGCATLLSSLLPFLSASSPPLHRDQQVNQSHLRRGALVMQILTNALIRIQHSPIRPQVSSIIRSQWPRVVLWMRTCAAHDLYRTGCLAFFIQLITFGHSSEEVMTSEDSIELMLCFFIPPHPATPLPESPAGLDVRFHTDSIFIAFAFFTNSLAINLVQKRLYQDPERLESLFQAFLSRLRDTVQCAVLRRVSSVTAINTVTQCFAIAYSLMGTGSGRFILPWASKILVETVGTVVYLSEKEPATSKEVLSEIVDFLKFVVKWTESPAFFEDPLLPLVDALKGGALRLLISAITQLPEDCETYTVAFSMLEMYCPYIPYKPVLNWTLSGYASIKHAIAPLANRPRTCKALDYFIQTIDRSRASLEREASERLGTIYCDNLKGDWALHRHESQIALGPRGMVLIDFRPFAPSVTAGSILTSLKDVDTSHHVFPRLNQYVHRAQEDPSSQLTLGVFAHGSCTLYILVLFKLTELMHCPTCIQTLEESLRLPSRENENENEIDARTAYADIRRASGDRSGGWGRGDPSKDPLKTAFLDTQIGLIIHITSYKGNYWMSGPDQGVEGARKHEVALLHALSFGGPVMAISMSLTGYNSV